ncbi:hypothetical protein F4692_001654 [Nocardioides cavernae]|uniref:GH16 domain-containing protein n=1 Tax=Nocardioides cavernae TaxID=1921566 RepID=A0A7Y9KPA9_9ACTN|nr:hypothetical protein [Nocardioides cavernae]NYE36521.1 hypothetical protein [Nocardioides cavernae]
MLSSLTRALTALVPVVLAATLLAPAAHATLPRGDTVDSDPAPSWGWERVFADDFSGLAGAWPEQWHVMPGFNASVQDGAGLLSVGQLSQVRTNQSWALPVGTQVRMTARLLMPDTGTNYAAFWAQQPDGIDPRELDVIESYGPLKTTGAQLGSHLCYDENLGTTRTACEDAGLPAELWSVGHHFPAGAKPWETYWIYSAKFTVGADSVQFAAADGAGNPAYALDLHPDLRRVPNGALPFHLRLSNKDVLPEHAVAGGTRQPMFVDWVAMDVKYP